MDRPLQSRTRPDELTKERAKELRAKTTTPERVLWSRLRDGRLGGFKFRRQHPLGPFVADFYCHQAALVVAMDSGWHFTPERRLQDAKRDEWMAERNIRTLRVTASAFAKSEAAVLHRIRVAVTARVEELKKG